MEQAGYKVIVSGLVNPLEDDLGTTTLFSENLIWALPWQIPHMQR